MGAKGMAAAAALLQPQPAPQRGSGHDSPAVTCGTGFAGRAWRRTKDASPGAPGPFGFSVRPSRALKRSFPHSLAVNPPDLPSLSPEPPSTCLLSLATSCASS